MLAGSGSTWFVEGDHRDAATPSRRRTSSSCARSADGQGLAGLEKRLEVGTTRGHPSRTIVATVLPASKLPCRTVSFTALTDVVDVERHVERRSAAISARSASSMPLAAAHSGVKECHEYVSRR